MTTNTKKLDWMMWLEEQNPKAKYPAATQQHPSPLASFMRKNYTAV